MNNTFIGEFAALFTSLCWSLSAVAFTVSGRQIGSQLVNRIRVLLAFVALIVINWILYGQAIPINAGGMRWFWLVLSGVVGLAIGDTFLFRSYQLIGARLGLLLLSLAPVFSAALGWIIFGETLTLLQITGMLLTLAGISWVVLARPNGENGSGHPQLSSRGVLFGILAGLGQAGGLVLSKLGMNGDFPPFAGTLMRMTAALIILWGIALFRKQAVITIKTAWQNTSAFRWVAFGALVGPVIGISASLLAIQHTHVGIASTLMALPPVFVLPFSYFFFKERFDWQAIAGTAVAILGIALLFLKT